MIEGTSVEANKHVHFNPTCKVCNVKLKNLTGTNLKVCPKCWKQYGVEELFEGDDEAVRKHVHMLQEEPKPYYPQSIVGAILSRHLYTRIRPDGIRTGTALCDCCGEKIDVRTYNRKAVKRRIDHVVGRHVAGKEVVLCSKCIEPYCHKMKDILVQHKKVLNNGT